MGCFGSIPNYTGGEFDRVVRERNILANAILAYLSECDNPVPDYMYRRTLRNHMRELVGAPPEPKSRAVGQSQDTRP